MLCGVEEIPDEEHEQVTGAAQAGVLRAADPVLAPGPAPVTQFQVSELPGPGVGRERSDAVPVDVGEPQLRAEVGTFLADGHPHSGRPG